MSAEQQQQFDSKELLADIDYINQANKYEIGRIRNSIRQRMAEAANSNEVIETIINEVSAELGQLKSSVDMTDKALNAIRKHQTTTLMGQASKAGSGDVFARRFTARQLAGTKNMLPVETVEGGARISWSGSEPEIRFSFDLDRRDVLEMQMHLFCVMRKNYARNMKVFIDGNRVKHWNAIRGSSFVIACKLPVTNQTTETEVCIVLPGTVSPSDISDSPDTRKLGIAISEIRFDKPMGALSRLLMKLRVK